MPDTDYVNSKFDALREKFGFANSIMETIGAMGTQLSTATTADSPPQVKIDLGKANSKYDWGSTCYVLDLSWYAPYKPMVDSFLSAVMWAFFVWRLFVALPNIINGISGTSGAMENYGPGGLSEKGMKRRGR